ncbi:hypothetical protein THAOC_28727 [Thalassiosira oceanica]|uniref:Uncharacterized protein n=1 Tax=Thalassiosira oceanica TaxID=159749 RepID=K0RFK9_THAOC|nr:hypothetical protein THAOC_28727 [Thalassiosira oceanica]|eukprot:EJK52045.1 hypothetical protein THAOC_28727 [Thalassiosira oceanica]
MSRVARGIRARDEGRVASCGKGEPRQRGRAEVGRDASPCRSVVREIYAPKSPLMLSLGAYENGTGIIGRRPASQPLRYGSLLACLCVPLRLAAATPSPSVRCIARSSSLLTYELSLPPSVCMDAHSSQGWDIVCWRDSSPIHPRNMPPVPLSNKRRYEDADTLSLMAGAKSNRFSVTSGDGGRQIDGRDIGPCPPPILGAEIRSLLRKRGGQRPPLPEPAARLSPPDAPDKPSDGKKKVEVEEGFQEEPEPGLHRSHLPSMDAAGGTRILQEAWLSHCHSGSPSVAS